MTYDFYDIYQFWLNLWNSFLKFATFLQSDMIPYVEDFLFTFFGKNINIPFELSLADCFADTTIYVLCAFAIVGFAFRVAKDIINPFN